MNIANIGLLKIFKYGIPTLTRSLEVTLVKLNGIGRGGGHHYLSQVPKN